MSNKSSYRQQPQHYLARQHQLTLNTLFQGAWAVLLSRYSCENQVVYGCGVSGRPVDLGGVESMLGVHQHLPVCVKLSPEQFLIVWLKAGSTGWDASVWVQLVKIQGGVKCHEACPYSRALWCLRTTQVRSVQNREDLEIVKFTSFYKTNYPLNVIGYPSSELVIGINYDCRRTPPQLPGYCGILRYCSKVLTNSEVRLGLAVAYGRAARHLNLGRKWPLILILFRAIQRLGVNK